MKRNFILIIFILFFLGTANNVFALSYNENAGDLANDQDLSTFVGTFDLGSNTVLGTTYYTASGTSADGDQDWLSFTVSDGMILTGISMAFDTKYTDSNDGDTQVATINWSLFNSPNSPPVYSIGDLDILNQGNIAFVNFGSYGPGTYIMGNDGGGTRTGDSWETNYTLNFQVSNAAAPVPEPATMFLFGAGLIGLAGVGRRKK